MSQQVLAADGPVEAVETRAYRKVFWRIVPFLMLCYVVAYLDRVNVGFAKLQMSQALGFSETVFGLGAGIFFLGYFLFEVPSNLILHRVGARLWIARIMVTWGVIDRRRGCGGHRHRQFGRQSGGLRRSLSDWRN